jgi:hypothetical protein
MVAAGPPDLVGLACLDRLVGFADGAGVVFFTAFATFAVFAAFAAFTFAIAHRS